MFNIFSFLIAIAIGTGCFAYSEDPIEDPMSPPPNGLESAETMPGELARAMDAFQKTSVIAEKRVRDGVLPKEEIEKQYYLMSEMLDDIIDLILYNPNNAYSFLNGKGFDKCIIINLGIRFPPFRRRLLDLTKLLFDIAPTTALTVSPWGILDKLMDIFEQDHNLAMKAQAMEMLSILLPGNPRAQERVMKLRGLQPFYKQISKLDSSVISMMLRLLNTLITEHMIARNKKMQKNKADYVTLRLYQKIGLIESISTPVVCNALLNVFAEVWVFTIEEEDALLSPILDLIQNIKPHCLQVYTGRSKAVALLNQILQFLKDPSKQEYLDTVQLNVTEITKSFTDFVEKIKIIPRHEL